MQTENLSPCFPLFHLIFLVSLNIIIPVIIAAKTIIKEAEIENNKPISGLYSTLLASIIINILTKYVVLNINKKCITNLLLLRFQG